MAIQLPTPTQNPVPSTDIRDAIFAGARLDEVVTSFALKYQDRFGKEHYTIEGIKQLAFDAMNNFGYVYVSSFEKGATLTEPNQALLWENNREYYKWTGNFPKEIPSNSTPDTSGGVMPGAWLSIGDALLRSMLLSSDGANLIGFGENHRVADLYEWSDNNGDSLIAVKQPASGAVPRTQHDHNAEFLTSADFGIVTDGSSSTPTDNAEMLQAAFDASYLLNKDLHLSGDIYFTGQVKCRRAFSSNGKLRFYGGTVTGSAFSSEIQMLRGGTINDCGLYRIKVSFFPTTPDENDKVADKECCWFYNNYGFDSAIYVGNDNSTVRLIRIYNNKFFMTGDRSYPFITFWNSSNIHCDNNNIQDYQYLCYFNATRSFVNSNIKIRSNSSSGAASVISMMGNSMNWFSSIEIRGNTFIMQPRSLVASGNCALYLDYVSGLLMQGNNINSSGGCFRIRYSREVSLYSNDFNCNTNLSALGSFLKVDGLIIDGGAFTSSGNANYAINISADSNSGTQVATSVVIKNTFWKVPERAIIFSNYQKVIVDNNIFQRNSSLGTSVIQINNTCIYGRVTNNDYFVPSGTAPVSNSAANTATAGGAIINGYAPASITVISNGSNDSELNNSKAYIFSFVLSDANQIHSFSSNVRAPLSSLINANASSAKLAWNGGFFNSNASNTTGDVICDGTVVDFSGPENYWIPAALAINREGKLMCRDWMCEGDDTKGSSDVVTVAPVRNIAQAMIAEGLVNTQVARPPLISSGILYNAKITGIYGDIASDTTLSARTALGQKQDGTWILICVDGANGSTGCTLAQLRAKLASLGAHHAFNLDGGGSATIYYNGSVINNPSDGSERPLGSFMWI